jgi:acetolactate synthase-1/2/3 large subunit
MLTAAPGITNGLAPLYSASQAESPVLLISGDSSIGEDGCGAFQELDQVSITRPLTKLSLRPRTTQELYPALEGAVGQALAPRRGPVHLALPFDLLTAETGLDELPKAATTPADAPLEAGRLEALAALVNAAKRPLVLAGPSGARLPMRPAWEKLEAALGIRVVPMESPRGLKDPSLGSLSEVIPQADLIVLAGKCLDFTLGFGGARALGANARVAVIDPECSNARAACLAAAWSWRFRASPSRRFPPCRPRTRRSSGFHGAPRWMGRSRTAPPWVPPSPQKLRWALARSAKRCRHSWSRRRIPC